MPYSYLYSVSTSLLKYTISFLYKIALKICDKIASKEPFAVYILLPMWMEGIPQANATQGLLYYQRSEKVKKRHGHSTCLGPPPRCSVADVPDRGRRQALIVEQYVVILISNNISIT